MAPEVSQTENSPCGLSNAQEYAPSEQTKMGRVKNSLCVKRAHHLPHFCH